MVARCRTCSATSAPRVRARRGLLHRAARPQHPDRLHRPDLARATARSWRSAPTRPRSSSPTRAPSRPHVLRRLRDLATIPIAGLVAGVAASSFGLPALRLAGPTSRSHLRVRGRDSARSCAASTGSTGGGGINIFGLPGHTGDIGVRRRARPAPDLERVGLLPVWAIAGRPASWSRGCSSRAEPAARSGRSATARRRPRRPASTWRPTRRSRSRSAPSTPASPARCSRSRRPSSTRTRSRSRLSLTLLVGLVVGGLGSLAPLVAGAFFVVFLPTVAAGPATEAAGRPSRTSSRARRSRGPLRRRADRHRDRAAGRRGGWGGDFAARLRGGVYTRSDAADAGATGFSRETHTRSRSRRSRRRPSPSAPRILVRAADPA